MSNSYSDRAERFARDVVSGLVPACELTKLACQRQLNDLASPPSGFVFDPGKANRAVAFIELCPHTKGAEVRQNKNIKLGEWQIFIFVCLFGWVDGNGARRFRRSYIEIPRGNGKSTMSAPLGLYMLALDGEPGAEIYSAATTRDQAAIVFKDAQAMARKMPKFREKLAIEVTAHSIVQLKSSSSFKALSADAHSLDGLNIHLGIIDELHAHKARDVYDVIETGAGKRPQSLIWVITTAGTNKHGICYEVRDYVIKVLKGLVSDDRQFGIIYTIDEGDDPYEESSLVKANPNWGISVDAAYVLNIAAKAKETTTARANYLTKHLNVWYDANSALYDTEFWRKCEDIGMDEADYADWDAVIGLDLATKTDIAAKVTLYRKYMDGVAHYAVFPKFYLPQAAIDDSRHPMYRGWEMTGQICAMPGEVTDFAVIEDELLSEGPALNLKAVAADPWQAHQMIKNLESNGMPAQEYRNTVATMSEPTKELDALMRSGRIRHPGNAVMNWMIGNVVGRVDSRDNVTPRKDMPQNKIDGAIALIFALGWFLRNEHEKLEPPSVYEQRGVLVV